MLGKKITAIRKVILEGDSAIIGGNYKAYKDSMFDESHLEIDKGESPTYFKLRQLTDPQKDAIAGESSIRKQAKLAIRCSLVGVEGYAVQTDSGVKQLSDVDTEDHITCGRIVSKQWMEEANLPTEHLLDLYICVDSLSEAKIPLSKRSVAPAGQVEQQKTELRVTK